MGCFHSKQDEQIVYRGECGGCDTNSFPQKKHVPIVVEDENGQCVSVQERKVSDVDSLIRFRAYETKKLIYEPKLTACGMKHIGFGPFKRENQDRFVVSMEELGLRKGSLFGVFDGHGVMGRYAAEFAQQILPLILNQAFSLTQQKQCSGQVASYVEAIKEDICHAFVETERRMIESGVNMNNSGTTASIAYLEGSDLWVASAGDSRVVMGTCEEGMLSSVELSVDHRPSNPDEKARVEAAGGRVEPKTNAAGQQVGEPRLWLQDLQTPGLMVTRSIGDTIATDIGCISTPQVCYVPLKPFQDDFLVLATDGLWDVLSSSQVVQMVYNTSDAPTASKELMQCSLQQWEQRWAADNITIIVVTFHWDYPEMEEEEDEEEEDDDECISPITMVKKSVVGVMGGLNRIEEHMDY